MLKRNETSAPEPPVDIFRVEDNLFQNSCTGPNSLLNEQEERETQTRAPENGESENRRSKWNCGPPDRYGLAFSHNTGSEPPSYNEAIKSDEAHLWKEALDAEYKALMENKTWELIDTQRSAMSYLEKGYTMSNLTRMETWTITKHVMWPKDSNSKKALNTMRHLRQPANQRPYV